MPIGPPPAEPAETNVDTMDSLALVLDPSSAGPATVHGELSFDRRGCSQAIDVTRLSVAQVWVQADFGGAVALECLVGDGVWHAVAVAELANGVTTLLIPTGARVVRTRLRDHARRRATATLVGRIESASNLEKSRLFKRRKTR